MWQRVMIGGARRPRLLIEHSSHAYRFADFGVFHDAGFDVTLCSGPDEGDHCPLVESGRCDFAASADVVYFGLDLDEPDNRAVLRGLRAYFPDTPVVVEEPTDRLADHGDAVVGCGVLRFPASLNAQVRALRRALNGAGAPT